MDNETYKRWADRVYEDRQNDREQVSKKELHHKIDKNLIITLIVSGIVIFLMLIGC